MLAHRVEPEEVEEAFLDPNAYTSRTGRGKGTRRYLMIARTDSGRYLRIFFERLPEGTRVVTAFDATNSDYRLYLKKK